LLADKSLAEPPPKRLGFIPPAPRPDPNPKLVPRLSAISLEEKARAEQALVRGEKYFAEGSILVARQFFERAAEAGLAAGAFWLAATFDPVELNRLHAQGIVPDRDLARKWYERARELGAPEAEERLAKLGGK
jgi:TPR repeat protein